MTSTTVTRLAWARRENLSLPKGMLVIQNSQPLNCAGASRYLPPATNVKERLMGMDLFGAKGSFMVNIHGWDTLLRLARLFGWEPAGTIPNPSYEDPFAILHHPNATDLVPPAGRRGYFYNDGDMVTWSDAQALADALEKALSNANQPAVRRLLFEEEDKSVSVHNKISRFPTSDSKKIEWVEKFINFCRGGGFIIL